MVEMNMTTPHRQVKQIWRKDVEFSGGSALRLKDCL